MPVRILESSVCTVYTFYIQFNRYAGNQVPPSAGSTWQDITFFSFFGKMNKFFISDRSAGELLAPAGGWGGVYLDPGEGWVSPKKMQRGKAHRAALIHHPNVLRHFPIRSCQVGWSHYYIIIMVSFLSFIRVIAAICHSDGNVPVDKDL